MLSPEYLRRQAENCLRIARTCFDLASAERLRLMAAELNAKTIANGRAEPPAAVRAAQPRGKYDLLSRRWQPDNLIELGHRLPDVAACMNTILTRLSAELIEKYEAEGFWQGDTIYALVRWHAEAFAARPSRCAIAIAA